MVPLAALFKLLDLHVEPIHPVNIIDHDHIGRKNDSLRFRDGFNTALTWGVLKKNYGTYLGDPMSEDKPRIDGMGLAGGVKPAAISSASSSGMCKGENGVDPCSPPYRLRDTS